MSARTPTPEQLDALRDCFRRSPPSRPKDFREAAHVAGVSESAARTAWSRGFVGVEPIEAQLARERGLQAQSAELVRVESVVRAAVANAATLQAEMLQLRPVVQKLRENLLLDVNTAALQVGPEKTIALLDKLARTHGRVAAVSQRAVELHRLVNGEATSIVGVKRLEPDAPMDADATERLIEIARRDAQRAKARQEKAQDTEKDRSDGDGTSTVN